MPVEISSTSPAARPSLEAHLSRAAEVLLGALQHSGSEFEVALVTDAEITELNRDYRGKADPTDVLSFPQHPTAIDSDGQAVGDDPDSPREDPEWIDIEDDVHLGDIAISVETAARQAEAGGWTLDEEATRLLLHGLLHLLGFDHEHGGEEEARMKTEEERLAAVLHAAGISCAHTQSDAES